MRSILLATLLAVAGCVAPRPDEAKVRWSNDATVVQPNPDSVPCGWLHVHSAYIDTKDGPRYRRFAVFDEKGALVVPSSERPTESPLLALPPGRYIVVVATGPFSEKLEQVQASVEKDHVTDLDLARPTQP